MKSVWLLGGALVAASVLTWSAGTRAMTVEDRQSYRQMLLLNLPSVPTFDQWVLKTDELPPDFDALPRHNTLPDPLTFFDGKPVKNATDWKARREEILDLYQKYVWGKLPPQAKYDRAIVSRTIEAQGGTLYAGPEGKGTLHIALRIPAGKGPFPVVLGPGLMEEAAVGPDGQVHKNLNEGTAAAADKILAHGYIVASYSANDAADDSENLAKLFPGADAGALPRRGWAASVAVDYLLTLPEVDGKHIALAGYGRDAKAATIGAALDERIAAVIAGSPGIGGTLPFRLAGEINQAESIQSLTAAYPGDFHPRLRYFAGREDRLPVDGNLLLAALAPRPYFLMAGQNDEVSNDYGDEQALHSAQKAYDLLGTKDKLGIVRVPGTHGAADWEQALTFLDIQFGKSDKKWTNQWIFPWDFAQWKKATGETVDLAKYSDRKGATLLTGSDGAIATTEAWEKKAAEVRKNVQWMLGDPTPAANPKLTPGPLPENPPDMAAWVMRASVSGVPDYGWYAEDAAAVASRAVNFNGVKGTLYYPRGAGMMGAKLPAVVWLHGTSYPLGYMWGYRKDSVHPILGLVGNGYAVLAYDQCGFGTRMKEAAGFYDRTPQWSQMGRMVADARAAVDALGKDALVDGKRVYVFGYGMGGTVALYTAALEPKVAGVVSVCGFTPLRTGAMGAEEVAGLSVERGMMPRLGFFVGSEGKVPADFDEVLGAIAPRPMYIANPLFDRGADFKEVHAAGEAVKKVYGLYKAEGQIRVDEPYDYDRLSPFLQDRILMWMRGHMQ